MKILQLCFFTNLWNGDHQVVSIDIKSGTNVLDLSDYAGIDYDLIVAAPPCDQFSKANVQNWQTYPVEFVKIAYKCFKICVRSGRPWVLENPPGRIETFIPDLKRYRVLNWRGSQTNKEYILYSNQILLNYYHPRYGKKKIARSKTKREMWQIDLVQTLERAFFN